MADTVQPLRRTRPSGGRFEKVSTEVEGVFHPMTKIVAYTSDKQRIIRQYGPDGRLLKSTAQIRSAYSYNKPI